MNMNKADRLEGVLRGMIEKSGQMISSCVIITERGLIVAGMNQDNSTTDTLPAMVSLMSDTATRICTNLRIGTPKTALIKSMDLIVAMQEFPVMERRFRIGAVIDDSRKFSILRGRLVIEKRMQLDKVENLFVETTETIQSILEGN